MFEEANEMGWMRYIAVALINTLGVVVGIIWVPIPQRALAQSSANTPEIEYTIAPSSLYNEESEFPSPETITKPTVSSTPQSLEDLYRLRDQLKSDIEQVSGSSDLSSLEAWQYELQLQQYQTRLRTLRQTETRIQREEQAAEIWRKAIQLATEAVNAGTPNSGVQNWEKAQNLWVQAIDTIRQIPSDTFLSKKAIEKIVEYQGYLAIATYERAIIQSQPENQPTPQKTQNLDLPKFPGFEMYGDTNRDGMITEADQLRPAQWSLSTGPLILFNNNDDNRSGIPDWKDKIVNGKHDYEDLAPVHFKISEDYQEADIFITTDQQAKPFVNIFQKTTVGWVLVDLTGQQPLVKSEEIILGVEAKQFADQNWTGLVTLKAVARSGDQEIASDRIQMGVAPWMMSPNTVPVSAVHLSDRGANQDVIKQVQQIVEKTGATPKITPGETAWMRDTAKIGYVQFPTQNGLKTYPVALNGNRSNESDHYAKSLMNRNFGWFEVGQPRSLDPLNQWLDGYGNLEVTPPIPNYPMGRIYYGKADGKTLHPDVVEFLKAQQVQGPPVAIDTSWLMIRHVSEIINFIPSQTGQPLLLIVSPEAGIKLIEELAEKGFEGAAINRGLSTQTTVRGALSNRLLVQHNLQLQREKIDPLLKKLKREFNLEDHQIIQVPVLFGYSGYAWWPNLVNAVSVNGELLVPNPRGPLIDGRDYIQEHFKRRLAITGMNINFLDDSYYQELKGNIYTGINTTREGSQKPFWKSLPANLNQ